MNLFTKQKQDSVHKQTYGYQRGKVWQEKSGVSINIHTAIYKIDSQQ